MKKNENNTKRIFDKQTKTWFEVTPEEYKVFDQERTRLRKREQYHHRCMCPRSKWWLCDGMCQDCEFHAPGDTFSLDKPIMNDDGDEVALMQTSGSPRASMAALQNTASVLSYLSLTRRPSPRSRLPSKRPTLRASPSSRAAAAACRLLHQ